MADPYQEPPDIITLRFTRVVFGVSSSPFFLNATVNHHMETYRQVDPEFVNKFLSSVYVDDVVSGSSDVETAYKFYEKSRQRLSVGGFRLRKFVTNSDELRARILRNESQSEDGGVGNTTHAEEDQSYAKSSLGVKMSEEQGVQKILGVEWNVASDNLQFDIGEVVTAMENSEPTKRSVVSATAKFFDPLGIVSSFSRCFSVRPS